MTKSLAKQKVLASDRDPWTKQPWESHPAFDAFTRYRDMESRSLAKLAQAIAETTGRNVASVESQVGSWSARNLWQERVEAYTLHLDRITVETREQLHRRIEGEDLDVAEQMLRIVRNSTDVMDAVGAGLPLELVDRWIEKAVKIRRLAAGLATDNVKAGLVITSNDMSRILNTVVDIACDFIEPSRREEFILRVTEAAS